jgi:hypothetical protein
MMENINGMVQSMVGEAPLRRKMVKYSAKMNQDYDVGLDKLLEIGVTNTEVLSYLWLAIDAGKNILITGPEFSGKKQLLFALSPFIPKYEKVLVFGNGTRNTRYYNNFVSFVSDGRVSGNQIKSSRSHNANRIILDKINGPEARELFSCANYGIPFLTTLDFCLQCGKVADTLKEKPTNVAPNTINMLDVVVSMTPGSHSVWGIESIDEFRWLSRSEIWIEEAKTLKDFYFKITNMVEKGKLSRAVLKGSKVIEAYGNFNLLGTEEVKVELDKRTSFLEDPGISKLPVHKYIENYFGENKMVKETR